jgi:carbon storage regulator
VIVIPRKVGECVVIGDDILVTVVEVRGDKVRLAVAEIYEAILSQPETRQGIEGFSSR